MKTDHEKWSSADGLILEETPTRILLDRRTETKVSDAHEKITAEWFCILNEEDILLKKGT